jgi:hypothetical protein
MQTLRLPVSTWARLKYGPLRGSYGYKNRISLTRASSTQTKEFRPVAGRERHSVRDSVCYPSFNIPVERVGGFVKVGAAKPE